MDRGTEILRTLAAWILVTVFLFPVVVQFSHIFQGDDHVICTEKTGHLHQKDVDCPICHFHLVPFDYDVTEYSDLPLAVVPTTVQNYFSSPSPRSIPKTGIQLRAPPHYLG